MKLKIEQVRESRGITRKWVADQLGIEQSTLWRVEKGKRGCSAVMLARIASLLHCKMDELITIERPKKRAA